MAFLHIPFGNRLRSLLGLGDDRFQSEFWMHALVTSIATLLAGTVPISTLTALAPLLVQHARTAASGRLTAHSGGAKKRDSCDSRDDGFRDNSAELRGGVLVSGDGGSGGGGVGVGTGLDGAADDEGGGCGGGSGGGSGSDSGGGSGGTRMRAARYASLSAAAAATVSASPASPARDDDYDDAAVADGADGAERGRLRGALQEALHLRQRRAASEPVAVFGHGVAPAHSEEDPSSDDEEGYGGRGKGHWPRSLRLGSLLVRRLPWPRRLHQHARRQRRSLMLTLRRAAAALVHADGLAAEGRRPTYDPMLDHARLALEWGYALMFTVVWPLAPLCCLLISALEQRSAAVRLCVSCQRPSSGLRSDGLGTANAWLHVLTLLAWVSVPINCGMIAMATQQLDEAQAMLAPTLVRLNPELKPQLDHPLPPFEKLLVAVIAEHILLACKLAIGISCAGGGAEETYEAREVAEEQRRRLRGVHGLNDAQGDATAAHADVSGTMATGMPPPHAAAAANAASAADATAADQPRLTALFPTSGACANGASVSLRGERLGAAVSRGELSLRLTLPRPGGQVTVLATFVSERKISCNLPPAPAPGLATIELLLPDGTTSLGGGATAVSIMGKGRPAAAAGAAAGGAADIAYGAADAGAAAGTLPVTPAVAENGLALPLSGACTFRYYAACSAHRLRPSAGPRSGGTAVRILGHGFVPTGELTVCVRLQGVERRMPAAFFSEGEVRFLTPSFGGEVGDAKVTLSLNGQDYEQTTELCYRYQSASLCAVQ